MATLERVIQMQREGYNESQIIANLKQEGISPKDIYDALTQAKIKSELSQRPMESETQEMQLSMNQGFSQVSEDGYTDYSDPSINNQYDTSLAQPQGYYPQQQPQQYQEYQPPQPTTDIETINEIAEQIVEEKNIELKKQIAGFKNFSEETKSEIERLNIRLEKLENGFSELQIAILRKIGEYGENIKNVATEMHETQNSFSKILNPLTDNIRELQKITQGSTQIQKKSEIKSQKTADTSDEEGNKEPKRSAKSGKDFEEYLR
jgi:hypothetical protein